MSFIPKQQKHEKIRLNLHVRKDIADQANDYAAYLESDLDHVIEQLFLKAFKADKEFQKSARAAQSEHTEQPKATKAKAKKQPKDPSAITETIAEIEPDNPAPKPTEKVA
jgi:thiamine pyrophosphate-dependent acetolactate synthase large subunit-like protein